MEYLQRLGQSCVEMDRFRCSGGLPMGPLQFLEQGRLGTDCFRNSGGLQTEPLQRLARSRLEMDCFRNSGGLPMEPLQQLAHSCVEMDRLRCFGGLPMKPLQHLGQSFVDMDSFRNSGGCYRYFAGYGNQELDMAAVDYTSGISTGPSITWSVNCVPMLEDAVASTSVLGNTARGDVFAIFDIFGLYMCPNVPQL
jgi:hypothetical protein